MFDCVFAVDTIFFVVMAFISILYYYIYFIFSSISQLGLNGPRLPLL